MKKGFLVAVMVLLVVELSAVIGFSVHNTESDLDTVAVNEVVQSVKNNWNTLRDYENETELDFVVIDSGGEVLFRTREGLSENINTAVSHRDTILDGENGGKLIIYNDLRTLDSDKTKIVIIFAVSLVLQCVIYVVYAIVLNLRIAKPFRRLKCFAERVAGGNLDIPLEMDRGNLFGAFTESFDIMRSELKKARIAEAKANASKKELVAKLSHDIRTPVASIKAVAELGAATADNEKSRENYTRIILKADQINTLVGNLFSATLEELQQLSVLPADMPSTDLRDMLESADYLCRAEILELPECMIYADKLRLQQVLDNIFANSYKYANTQITVKCGVDGGQLFVEIEDFGGGVSDEELPFLKEKFKRGTNTENIDGAGLGLYISDRFMTEMKGGLVIENGRHGLKITVIISLSGKNLRNI